MKGKKGILIVMAVILVLLATQMGFCETKEEAESEPAFFTEHLNYTMIKTDTWNIQNTQNSQKKMEQLALDDKDQFFHNNGLAMTTDLFRKGESHGNYLVAVYRAVRNGRTTESYYFTTEPKENKAALVKRVTEQELEQMTQVAPLAVGNETRTFSWVEEKNGKELATLTTNVDLLRKTKNASINGVDGSIWDITTFTQYEKKEAVRINNYYTRLSADKPNQQLLAYGPIGDSTGGTLNVNLTGGFNGGTPVPGIGYSFSISGFSVKDYSSLSGKYGRWKFYDGIGNLKSMTTKPGIRVSNTSGSLVIELSHTTDNNSGIDEYAGGLQTGVIQIWVTDR